jgi:uncharacterized protein YgiM (DUF1202 family)
MSRLTTLIKIALLVLIAGLLAQLSAGGSASWAAPGQDAERQTVPTRTPTPRPVTPTSPPPTSPPSAPPTPAPAMVTVRADTDIYDGPGSDYAIVGSLKAGARAVVVGRNADSSWWQIEFEADKGWIADAAVTANPAARNAPVVNAPSADATGSAPIILPRAGGAPVLLWGGAFLLLCGALLLLAGKQARPRRG